MAVYMQAPFGVYTNVIPECRPPMFQFAFPSPLFAFAQERPVFVSPLLRLPRASHYTRRAYHTTL